MPTVTLERVDGERHTVDVREGETVLDAVERTDTSLPYGCLTGACGTCTGRLRGECSVREVFEYERPPRALKDDHEADGYVLLCIAIPRRDCRVEVGADVQADLVSNPWK